MKTGRVYTVFQVRARHAQEETTMRIGRMILAMAILSTSATPASEQAATSPRNEGPSRCDFVCPEEVRP